MTNSTSTIWYHCWICPKLPAVSPTIGFAIFTQISRQWTRQITSHYYYKGSFDFTDRREGLGPQGAELHTLRNVGLRKETLSRLISYLLEFKWTVQAFQIQPWPVLSSSQSHFVHCNCPWWKFQPPHRALGHQLCHKALFTGLTLPCEMPEWPLKPHVLVLSLVSCKLLNLCKPQFLHL